MFNSLLLGFFVGLVVGTNLGILVAALLKVNKRCEAVEVER
jgi:Na+/H+ antiporter NhaA